MNGFFCEYCQAPIICAPSGYIAGCAHYPQKGEFKMSSFICDRCGAKIINTPVGYVTGCEHYPLEYTEKVRRNEKLELLTRLIQNERESLEKTLKLGGLPLSEMKDNSFYVNWLYSSYQKICDFIEDSSEAFENLDYNQITHDKIFHLHKIEDYFKKLRELNAAYLPNFIEIESE